ncbi:PepSY-associated TM helix domain-containing protein [Zhihengliuella halotolerans]|uniref:Putative iron-regulated membrane protein n=1 Tax=Zhihengliuella halotolerans TaxID=370736 RepID=A0A4Q8AF23_9MICC|nr:PepSY-associated TM helix domain-containing protein [Zhihengliuella halotolerans]RZU62897.1 putative iron-regulated membrane protein [Zhihengliuella halotolerans]
MRPWFGPLVRRLHFYAGLFIGPFILVAALSGVVYAVTPTIENAVYEHELTAPAYDRVADARPLAEQLDAADDSLTSAGYELSAVRPAPEPGSTTRIMYTHPDLRESETHAVFVDPTSLEVRGAETVYGTSGALPLRTAVSQFHRHLGLGDVGRLYSEMAASWLWLVALGGLALWLLGRRRSSPAKTKSGHGKLSRLHGTVGVWVLLGALFLSATGLTWSAYAGANVSDLRSTLGWTTPTVSTSLEDSGTTSPARPPGGPIPKETTGERLDAVWASAKSENIDTDLVEIKPGGDASSAWTVTEIQRSFPTKVDAIAIDPATLQAVDRADFADYSVPAKLARWGVDLHMGALFGMANQVALAVLGLAVATLVVLGYSMWFKRGPGRAPRALGLVRAPWWGLLLVLGVAAGIGLFLPLLGLSLAAFVVVDGVVAALTSRTR